MAHPTIADKLPGTGTTIFTIMSQLAQEHGAINLSQGFPDLPLDPGLIALVNEAMRAGHNQYAPMAGVPALREALSAKAERLYGVRYDPGEEVTITSGATQAIFTAIGAVVGLGDEVIVLDPAYDCYAPAVRLFGGTPVHVRLDEELRLDRAALAAAIGPRTRMLVINTPHNPGATVLSAADLAAVAALLEGTDIVLLSDEVYEHLVLDGGGHVSAMSFPGLRERAFLVFSFGKVFHATGWKLGYAMAPAPLMRSFRKVHQFNVFSAHTPTQHALAAHLADPANYEGVATMYRTKRDRFAAGLAGSRWRLLPCEGTYFQLADYTGISELRDREFAEQLVREHGVACIPLSPFYAEAPENQRVVRFCFAKQDSTLDAAMERLCAI